MAVKANSQAGKEPLNLSPDEEENVFRTKKEPEELNPSDKTEPWFKPKAGTVIPARRRLVKTRILDQIVQFFGTAEQIKNTDGKDEKKAEKVVKVKKLNSTEEEKEMMKMVVLTETQYSSSFKPKVVSVFPAKRKSVKRMMFDRLVVCFGSSVVSHSPPPSSAVASQSPQA